MMVVDQVGVIGRASDEHPVQGGGLDRRVAAVRLTGCGCRQWGALAARRTEEPVDASNRSAMGEPILPSPRKPIFNAPSCLFEGKQ